MTEEQKGTFLEIEQGLETPEGIVLAMRKRVAMSLMVLGVLETYLEEQVNTGHTPDSLPIFKSWPSFQNSTVRALAQLLATMPKPQADSYAEALKRINQVIDEQVEQQEQYEQVEQQEQYEQIEQQEQHDHVEQHSQEHQEQQEQQAGVARHTTDAVDARVGEELEIGTDAPEQPGDAGDVQESGE